MNRKAFCKRLRDAITQKEWLALSTDDCGLVISDFNRAVLCRMRNRTSFGGEEIDEADAKSLYEGLCDYLHEYMADEPQGHKWIILASLYLTFVEQLPMHPLERVGIITKTGEGGETLYFCPCKSRDETAVCHYCVSRYVE